MSTPLLRIQQLRAGYGRAEVLHGIDLHADKGSVITVIGPNGAGKSTLLKILAGVVPIQGGEINLGSNVVPGYFAQNRADNLKLDLTVFENVMELRTNENQLTEQQARAVLGGFLFRKDDVHKKVSVLSGGEKSRLALARRIEAEREARRKKASDEAASNAPALVAEKAATTSAQKAKPTPLA